MSGAAAAVFITGGALLMFVARTKGRGVYCILFAWFGRMRAHVR